MSCGGLEQLCHVYISAQKRRHCKPISKLRDDSESAKMMVCLLQTVVLKPITDKYSYRIIHPRCS